MGDENHIRTLADYSKPSHEGYRNTIELTVGNNVVPFRSNTIRLLQNGCSFYGLRSEDPNQHLKDFLKLVDLLDLDRSITTWEDLTTQFLAQFFPPGRTIKLRNDILMFQQHHGESLSEAWTRFKDLLQKVSHRGIDRPSPQPQALGTTFEARVRDYMAAHTERMERFENAIFKQREEINGRMTEMFRLLKELTTSKTPKKVLIREEAKFPVTKNVNSISLAREEEERSDKTDVTPGNTKMPIEIKIPVKEVEMNNEVECEPIKMAKEEETTKVPSSQPVEYYLKHDINKKLIEGLVDNHRFNDFLSRARAGKTKRKTYNISPKGPIYEAIFRKGITRKEDIGGNFEIPFDVVEHVYPVDFVILDIKEDKKRPFMLGTPFLTTAKAVIKFDKGTITLRSGKSKISFYRISKSSCKIEKGVKNDIEPIAPIMTVNRLVLEWEERIKLHLEKEMKFNQ
ncbi:zinc finger, CCHC-type containing protein [Tanacetum coccineum]